MMISKSAFKLAVLPVLFMGGVAQAHQDCHKDCPVPNPVVSYTVNTYEDNQDFCGYDVDGYKQVCVNANVVQVDTTKITQTAGVHSMKANAETTSDLTYVSKVSFGDGM